MKTKLTLALMALITSSAFAGIPKVLPEFKNAQQLAEWRDEMAAKHAATTTASAEHAFYTGKPYIASTGSYAFKYRSYNPELARWTSEDPSGFPDGANGSIYAPTPTSGIDPLGLNTLYVNDLNVVGAVVSGWESTGYIFAARLANHSLDQLDDRVADIDEINAMQQAKVFKNWFNLSWWNQHYGSQGPGTYSYSHVLDFGSGLSFGSDLHLSYGQVTFEFTAEVTSYNSGYKYDVAYSFEDLYDFNPDSQINAIRAFDALQKAGIASKYVTNGTFNITYE